MHLFTLFVITAIILTLPGCSTTPRARSYTPASQEVSDIVYKPLTAPDAAPREPEPLVIAWPVRGRVISSFGDTSGSSRNKGIDIRAARGDVVHAAAAGRIVYCDSSMRGLGKAVIIDHPGPYQTVYAYNDEILVSVGDAVMTGDPIARAGSSGRATGTCLHFELRRDGEPLDPLAYLR